MFPMLFGSTTSCIFLVTRIQLVTTTHFMRGNHPNTEIVELRIYFQVFGFGGLKGDLHRHRKFALNYLVHLNKSVFLLIE